MKILGVDFGDKRTGLAVSDETEFLASGLETVTSDGKNKLAKLICDRAKSLGCGLIVVGNPINMDGTAGGRSQRACDFGALLSDISGLPVEMYDERCSTIVAHTYLNATNTRGSNRKAVVDTLSAQIILQNFLDKRKSDRKN